MSLLQKFFDYVMHLDANLLVIINHFGPWAYLLIFVIIFLETALVLTPFLPGDSLLFAAGALAGIGTWNIWILFAILSLAAILGDSMNYSIGKYIGPRVFKYKGKLLNRKYLDRTHSFFLKYGGKTIIIARFIPVVRTFAPFLAGVGKMDYLKFLSYNVIGGIMWVGAFLWTGYFFGNLSFVKDNFAWVVVGIIVVSMIPAGIELYRHLKERKKDRKNPKKITKKVFD